MHYRRCRRCGVEITPEKKVYERRTCVQCESKRTGQWKAENRERHNAYTRNWMRVFRSLPKPKAVA